MGKTSLKKKPTVKIAEPTKMSAMLSEQPKKRKVKPVASPTETDSTTDNDAVLLKTKTERRDSKKSGKKETAKQSKSAPVPMKDVTSSSSDESEIVPQKPAKKVKTKKHIPKKVVPEPSSSSDTSSSEESSDESMIKTKPTKEEAADSADDDSSSSSSDDSTNDAPQVKSQQLAQSSSSSSSSDDDDDDDDTTTEDDASDDTDDSSDDEAQSLKPEKLLHAQNAACEDDDSTSSDSDDNSGDATVKAQQDSKMENSTKTTYDPSILKAWTCQIKDTHMNPIWLLEYEANNAASSIVEYRVEIVKTAQGEVPKLLMVNKDTFNDSSLQSGTKKRARISLDDKPAQDFKKQFQLDSEGKQEVFVGNLPYGTSEQELRSLFEDSCGRIVRIKLLSQGGAAFIEFESAEALKSALEWNRSDYNGRKLNINLASEKPVSRGPGFGPSTGVNRTRANQDGSPNSTVIVRNIPFSATVDSLKSFFSECGNVSHVNLPIYPDSNKIKGFGVVHFSSATEANAALGLSGSQLNGRTITVEIAHARDGNNRGFQRNSGPRKSFNQKSHTGEKQSSHQLFNDD